MYTLILSVVTVFVLGATEAINVSKRNDGCLIIARCMQDMHDFMPDDLPFRNILVNISESSDIGGARSVFNDEDYNQLCRANSIFQSCHVNHKDHCGIPFIASFVSTVAEEMAYVCSDEGHEDLNRMVDSPCITDQTAILTAQVALDGCVMAAAVAEDDQPVEGCTLIQMFDELKNCTLATLTNYCGADFSSFRRKLWDITYKSNFNQLDCDEQARQIRHLKTRIFPLVLAGAKRRR